MSAQDGSRISSHCVECRVAKLEEASVAQDDIQAQAQHCVNEEKVSHLNPAVTAHDNGEQ